MDKNDLEKKVLEETILGYRRLITQRYQYKALKAKYDLPSTLNEERVLHLRDFFLNNIYPHPKKRAELDRAFGSLDDYLTHPNKLFRLIIDSTALLFKHGRHLPKIFRAAMGALKSFQKGTSFESQLVQKALNLQLEAPYSEADMYRLLKTLAHSEIKQLIKNSQFLFKTLQDRRLVRKIIEIIEHLIAKMKKRPTVYAPEEIRGLTIGRDIIKNGDLIYDKLSKEEKQKIFDLIIKIEGEFWEELLKN